MNVLKIVRKVFFIVINIVLGTLFWLIISENNYDFFKFIWLLCQGSQKNVGFGPLKM